MRTLKSIAIAAIVATVLGAPLLGCSPGRRAARHEVREDRFEGRIDRRKDRIEDRND